MIKIYGIKNCNKVREALKFLVKHQLDFEFIDYRKNNIHQELNLWIDKIGIDKLLNKRSATYRNLTDKNITQAIIENNPTLIQRPILITNNNDILIGLQLKQYHTLL